MATTHARPMSDATGYRPLTRIPERRSSRLFHSHADPPLPPPRHQTLKPPDVVTVRGRSVSPIKRPPTGSLITRTFVPAIPPHDILDVPRLSHPRLSLYVHLSAPLFIGGATIEGEIQVEVDSECSEKKRKTLAALSIVRISVSVVGIEHCRGRQEIFRALTTNVLHVSDTPITENTSRLFSVDLPVVMGPPPYRTKRLGIRYLLSCTIEFKIIGKTQFVRRTREVTILTAYDPEKALVNLSNPLVVSDELSFSRQSIYVTAGIHRETWIGGYLLFVDIRVDNKSARDVQRIQLQIERATVSYLHSAASVSSSPAEVVRLPDQMHKEIVMKHNVLKTSEHIPSQSEDFRTAQMQIPSGLVSIETGRFFGIRYFLNIQIGCSFRRRLRLQLPINLIHPNSIDIPPNSLAQVAASIEHKHRDLTSTSGTGSPYRYRPGQAFTTARQQSYLQLRRETFDTSDLDSIARAVEASPRKYFPAPPKPTVADGGSPKRLKITRRQSTAAIGSSDSSDIHRRRSTLSKHTSIDHGLKYNLSKPDFHEMCRGTPGSGSRRLSLDKDKTHHHRRSQQRVSFDKTPTKRPESGVTSRQAQSDLESNVYRHLRTVSGSSSRAGGPRLQRSASGMGFEDSDKENREPKSGWGAMRLIV